MPLAFQVLLPFAVLLVTAAVARRKASRSAAPLIASGGAALAAVLNWILEHFGTPDLPSDFVAYTADEVGRLRRRPLTNVERVRGELIQAIERSRARARSGP